MVYQVRSSLETSAALSSQESRVLGDPIAGAAAGVAAGAVAGAAVGVVLGVGQGVEVARVPAG
jgi:hypothetical protein